jgi:enterochelin esterase family protein
MIRWSVIIGMLALPCTLAAQPLKPPTDKELAEALKLLPADSALAERDLAVRANLLRAAVGDRNLPKGAPPKINGRAVAFAIQASTPSVKVVSKDGKFSLPLHGLSNNIHAAVTELPSGTAFLWHYDVGGKQVGGGQLEVYDVHPDSIPRSDVPKGEVRQMPPWESKIFAGTTRDWWIYIPNQYKPEEPACVLIFQDGGGYKDSFATVLDNLIAKGDIPVTVGIFINPGVFKDGRRNRSFEYDTLSDQYARFLMEEILPETEKVAKLRKDPASRLIGGISSGGICAFTAAWERPEQFGKVLSWVGSFTNIASGKTLREGGHNYPALIRKTPKKPIRVFLQDGANDLDNEHGSWPLANLQMDKALAFAKYDYQFVYGQGFHSNKHGLAILPDSLRWLWRDWKTEVK